MFMQEIHATKKGKEESMYQLAEQLRPGMAISPVQEPVEDRLARQRKQLMDEVEAIDRALEILNKQPELLETLNVLRRVGV